MTLLATITAALLAGIIVAGVVALENLDTARARLVDEIDPGLIGAQTLTSALLNQETGVRGYLLTGDRRFLAPYPQGLAEQARAVTQLRDAGARPGTVPGDDLDAVLERAGEWQRVADSWTAPGAPPVGVAQVEQSKAYFDGVREVLDTQRAHYSDARIEAREGLDSTASFLQSMLAVIAVLLIVLFAALYLGFRRAVARPLQTLATEVRAVTEDDLNREVRAGGPRELVELGADVEDMRRRIVAEVGELQHAKAELQRSNSDLEQFAYVASHDLQEPLRKVASFCQLLQRRYQGQLDERGDQYIEFAVDGARRMQALINDLLAFSRVGRKTGETAEVDTAKLVGQATRNVEATIEETGATVTHGELPVVHGEASLLTGVFQNLLSNALKFRGEEPPEVRIEAERDGDEWVFSVTDNGIGIEAEYADRIFAIFQRLHPKSAYPGTGIGLAMCRKIVEYHGGRIWLDTEAPAGRTRFRFTLPVTPRTPGEDTDTTENTESEPS
ncbi:ATP-binding protein [Amycolatopsis sp. 195334CR]|uniref:sensor histidine kinase n=1 Tax=Amycolatopsis sp. 195334CR TaxID=2814588 RepID=UPI001A8EFD14|nr:sensor histidine kinase [Amycolatopsis sp. 195334CR]MBN6041248.1 CHASE3 domain-containing protein [Amycolatopsis sp. 195334CR]